MDKCRSRVLNDPQSECRLHNQPNQQRRSPKFQKEKKYPPKESRGGANKQKVVPDNRFEGRLQPTISFLRLSCSHAGEFLSAWTGQSICTMGRIYIAQSDAYNKAFCACLVHDTSPVRRIQMSTVPCDHGILQGNEKTTPYETIFHRSRWGTLPNRPALFSRGKINWVMCTARWLETLRFG